MSEIAAFLGQFLVELLHFLPWFAVAIALSAILNAMSMDVIAERVFRRNGVAGVLLTAAIGAFSPFCSFTIIPILRRFLISGVPLSAVMAFWIASPTMDPEIFALTAAALGMPVALARLIGAIVLSVGGGLIVLALERRGWFRDVLRANEKAPAVVARDAVVATTSVGAGGVGTLTTSVAPCSAGAVEPPVSSCAAAATSCSGEPATDPRSTGAILLADLKSLRPRPLLRDMWSDTRSLVGWLVAAVAVGVAVERYLPTSLVTSILGADNQVVAVPLAALVSVPLYLNGVGAIPIVQGLMAQGMTPAAATAFLLGGATTTIPAIVAVRSIVTNRAFLAYLGCGFGGALLFAWAMIPLL